jgi:hypothetical protein
MTCQKRRKRVMMTEWGGVWLGKGTPEEIGGRKGVDILLMLVRIRLFVVVSLTTESEVRDEEEKMILS